jgi:hypothetical protein
VHVRNVACHLWKCRRKEKDAVVIAKLLRGCWSSGGKRESGLLNSASFVSECFMKGERSSGDGKGRGTKREPVSS